MWLTLRKPDKIEDIYQQILQHLRVCMCVRVRTGEEQKKNHEYVFTAPATGRVWHKLFLCGVKLVFIQSFLSLILPA